MSDPLLELARFGQSLWYDNIRRGLITSGELQELVERGGIVGVTSNPSIFEKAIAGSPDYDQALKALVRQGVGDAKAIYEKLAIADIQLAADVLYPVYARSEGKDGYVSLEVSPYLTTNTQGTLVEARRLHAAIGRDNLMIKVPATPEGLPAIRRLIAEGINVNVTLIFSLDAYAAVADAYLAGLEDRLQAGKHVDRVASVASFFISRIDAAVDAALGARLDQTHMEKERTALKSLIGQIAIANARLSYARFQELLASERWRALAAHGARPQRLLWASTGTKNPKYSQTLYVDELIGPDTVNTVPVETYQAFKTSGRPRAALVEDGAVKVQRAREQFQILEAAGISFRAVTDQLLAAGVQSFSDAFDKLLAAVESKRQTLLSGQLAQQRNSLGAVADGVRAILEEWRRSGKARRLWEGDSSLWSSTNEDRWLGWLHVAEGQSENLEPLARIVGDVRKAGFRQIALLGMGGSSLCPEVLRQTFGSAESAPELCVLDSMVPAQIQAFEARLDLAHTLFIVASKSGTTSEPNLLMEYFAQRLRATSGRNQVGSHFIAITDPGTLLHKRAKAGHFRHIVFGVQTIGGRYSALSNFGLLPAALLGIDVADFLARTEIMIHSCAPCVPPEINPGVALGAVLGHCARQGRDKLTLVTSPRLTAFGTWLEQLIAESTGKQSTGIIPVDGELLGTPDVYGDDRLFVYAGLRGDARPEQQAALAEIERAGHPIVTLEIDDLRDLGQAFFRWELATAVAGSILGVNAFDQPDVETAKVAARELLAAFERDGALPEENPVCTDGDLRLFTDVKNLEALRGGGARLSLASLLRAHLARIGTGDYFAINAFLEMSPPVVSELQAIRRSVRDTRRAATTLGFGPRFLHSTGQLHKGGPNSGVFLQITADDAEDIPIPGQRASFGVLKQAQALGDFNVLAQRGRRIVRIHLRSDVASGLAQLREAIEEALSS